ncbi:Hexon-interlacing protein [Frankliniella fusca]|uniref:Hexon-interlacing protein n=1 Tax=Frankliniella fusca TaxID=407009 RepID=A0AAE1GSZ0_9NEOP|nr:Hexon-interlacing protein [Frankliniella fusca]
MKTPSAVAWRRAGGACHQSENLVTWLWAWVGLSQPQTGAGPGTAPLPPRGAEEKPLVCDIFIPRASSLFPSSSGSLQTCSTGITITLVMNNLLLGLPALQTQV